MRISVVCFILGVMASIAQAASVPSGPYDTSSVTCTSHQGEVDAFRVSCGPQSGVYSTRVSTIPQPGTYWTMLAKDATGSPGTYYCLCTVIDAGVESQRSNEQGFQLVQATPPPPIDTTPPTVSITFPTQGSTVARKTQVIVQATAADAGSGVDHVEMTVNNTLLCMTATSPFKCTWAVPAPKNATYILRAKAVDRQGNLSIIHQISVTAQ